MNERGYEITFYVPDAYDRFKTRIFLIYGGGSPVKSPALFVISPKIAQDFNF